MRQTGNASVVDVDGTIAINGATALAAFPESIEGEQRATVEEFLEKGELIGFRVSDEREYADLVIIPKVAAAAGAVGNAHKALKYPPIPAKITLANFPDSTGSDIGHNGDYIYVGGARRTMIRGQAALRITCFKPKTSSLTVTQLLTAAT